MFMFKTTGSTPCALALASVLAIGVASCGEETTMPEMPVIHSFKPQLPESYEKSHDLSSDEAQRITDDGVVFVGVALNSFDSDENVQYDIGIQFETKTEGRRVYVEKLHLDSPDLDVEKDVNELVTIDNYSERSGLYWKRFTPLENVAGKSIPLEAEFFTLTADYRLDDGPTQQMTIRMDNASFPGPVL